MPKYYQNTKHILRCKSARAAPIFLIVPHKQINCWPKHSCKRSQPEEDFVLSFLPSPATRSCGETSGIGRCSPALTRTRGHCSHTQQGTGPQPSTSFIRAEPGFSRLFPEWGAPDFSHPGWQQPQHCVLRGCTGTPRTGRYSASPRGKIYPAEFISVPSLNKVYRYVLPAPPGIWSQGKYQRLL